MAKESATAINKARKEAIEEAVKRLEETGEYFGDDSEKAHTEADGIILNLLRELGGGEAADAYDRISANFVFA